MSDTTNVERAAKEIAEVLHRHGIPITGIDYIVERVKELAHLNKIARSGRGEHHV